MIIDQKYLPTKTEQIMWLKNRIEEYKKSVLGGKLEITMAEANGEKRTVTQTEDMMQQVMTNIDILEAELDELQKD